MTGDNATMRSVRPRLRVRGAWSARPYVITAITVVIFSAIWYAPKAAAAQGNCGLAGFLFGCQPPAVVPTEDPAIAAEREATERFRIQTDYDLAALRAQTTAAISANTAAAQASRSDNQMGVILAMVAVAAMATMAATAIASVLSARRPRNSPVAAVSAPIAVSPGSTALALFERRAEERGIVLHRVDDGYMVRAVDGRWMHVPTEVAESINA